MIFTGFIYPIQDLELGGGFLSEAGRDFAGSGIVQLRAAAALAGVLVPGARKGKYGPNGEINASLAPICRCNIGYVHPLVGLVRHNGVLSDGFKC